MIVAVDSSVLLDLLTNDPRFARQSAAALSQLSQKGQLIVSPIVIAEIFPLLGTRVVTQKFLSDLSLDFVDFGLESSIVAGGIFDLHHQHKNAKKKMEKRVIADFLVGAHALIHSHALVTRDKGFYRPYFKDLKVFEPSEFTTKI